MKQNPLRSERGFSLIEVMVAFTILAISATSLFLLGSSSTKGNVRSKEHAAAASLAIDKVEALKNLPFAEITSAPAPETIDATGEAGGTFMRDWQVTDTVVSGTPAKNVTVTVSGPPGITVALSTAIIDAPVLIPDYLEGFPTVAVRSWSHR